MHAGTDNVICKQVRYTGSISTTHSIKCVRMSVKKMFMQETLRQMFSSCIENKC